MDLLVKLIELSINFFSMQFGVNQALAIILFTLTARFFLIPISFKAALDSYKNKIKQEALKPEIDKLKEEYSENPLEVTKQTMILYKQTGIKFLGKTTLLNIVTQGGLGLSLFSALKNISLHAKILWIANIAKPDILLSLAVGILTFLSMLAMPSSAEQSMVMIFIIPAIISCIVLSFSPAAIGIYWATSSIVTMMQNLALRVWVNKNNSFSIL